MTEIMRTHLEYDLMKVTTKENQCCCQAHKYRCRCNVNCQGELNSFTEKPSYKSLTGLQTQKHEQINTGTDTINFLPLATL